MLSTNPPPPSFREYIEKKARNLSLSLYHIERFIDLSVILLFREEPTGNTILHQVLEYDCPEYYLVDIIEILINRGMKIDTPNNAGITPLHAAVNRSLINVCRFLLEKNAAQRLSTTGLTPLHSAVENNDEDMVRLLCQSGAKMDIQYNGKTPLQIAVDRNFNKVILALLQYGANEEKDFPDKNSLNSDYHYIYVLGSAYRGDLEKLTQLHLQFPELLKLKDPRTGITPYLCAVTNGHQDVMNWLLNENLATFDEQDNYENDALLYAATNGQWEIFKTFLPTIMTTDDDFINERGAIALRAATVFGQVSIIQGVFISIFYADPSLKEMLNNKMKLLAMTTLTTNPQTDNSHAMSVLNDKMKTLAQWQNDLLMIAAKNGHLHLVKWLLYTGYARFCDALCTPLHLLIAAAQNEQFSVIKWLIIDYFNSKEFEERFKENINTPFQSYMENQIIAFFAWAAKNGLTKIIQYLVSIRFALYTTISFYTPLLPIAAANGQIETMDWLVTQKLESFKERSYGEIEELLYAAALGKLVSIKWIISRMQKIYEEDLLADKKILSRCAGNAMLEAAKKGHLYIVKWLILEAGVPSDFRESLVYESAILEATKHGHLALVKWLLKNRPEAINERDDNGDSVFLISVKNGHVELAKFFLQECGVSMHDIETTLFTAARKGKLEMVKCLVEIGHAPVNAVNTVGKTALFETHKLEVKKYLCRKQIDYYFNTIFCDDNNNNLVALDNFINSLITIQDRLPGRLPESVISSGLRESVILSLENGFLTLLQNTKANPQRIVETTNLVFSLVVKYNYTVQVCSNEYYGTLHKVLEKFANYTIKLDDDAKNKADSELITMMRSIIGIAQTKAETNLELIARWYHLLAEFFMTIKQYTDAYTVYRECCTKLGGKYADLHIAEMILEGFIDIDDVYSGEIDVTKIFPKDLATTELIEEKDAEQDENNNLIATHRKNQAILCVRATKAYRFVRSHENTPHGELLLRRINCYLAGKIPSLVNRYPNVSNSDTTITERWLDNSMQKFLEYYSDSYFISEMIKTQLLLERKITKKLQRLLQTQNTSHATATNQVSTQTNQVELPQTEMTATSSNTSSNNSVKETSENPVNNPPRSTNRTEEEAQSTSKVSAATTAPHAILFPTATPKGSVISVVTTEDIRDGNNLSAHENEDATKLSTKSL